MSDEQKAIELQHGEASAWNDDVRAFVVALIGADMRGSDMAPLTMEQRVTVGMAMADAVMLGRRKRKPAAKGIRCTKPVKEEP